MKILYILNEFPNPYHTFIIQDIRRLINLDNKVFILSRSKPHTRILDSELFKGGETYYLEDFRKDRKFDLDRIRIRVKRTVSKRFSGSRLVESIPLLKSPSEKYFNEFGWNILGFKSLAAKLREKRIDVIHAAFGSQETVAAMILSHMMAVPFSFETHAKDLFVHFRHSQEKMSKAIKVFTISDYNRRYLIEKLNCPEHKVIVKRVPFDKTYCDEICGEAREENLVVSVCRLTPIKGLEFAIEAFDMVARRFKHLSYRIIGDGPLRAQLLAKVERLGLGDRVTFAGFAENKRALECIRRATMVLLPSIIADDGDRDGIPTALIEAMYLKTPVIASRVSGIPELIDHGTDGFLAEPQNVSEIAARMSELLLNKALRTRMGERARQKIEREFTFEKSTGRLIAAWREMLPA